MRSGRLLSCTPGAHATPRRPRECTATSSRRRRTSSRCSPAARQPRRAQPVIPAGAVVAPVGRRPVEPTAPLRGWPRAPSWAEGLPVRVRGRGPELEGRCAARSRIGRRRPTATPTAAACTPTRRPRRPRGRDPPQDRARRVGRRASRRAVAHTSTRPGAGTGRRGRAVSSWAEPGSGRRDCRCWTGRRAGRSAGGVHRPSRRRPSRERSPRLNLGALTADDAGERGREPAPAVDRGRRRWRRRRPWPGRCTAPTSAR